MRLAALHPRRLTASRRFKRNVAGVAQPPFPVPFICGATRSGTTLLRLMLDAHPQLAIPGETHFIVPMIRASWRRARSPDELATQIVASERWGDFHLDENELRARLRALDPFNCADAVREFFRLYAEKQGKQRWGDKTPGYVRSMRVVQKVFPEARFIHIIRDGRDVALSLVPRSWGPSTFAEAADNWRRRIEAARRQQPHLNHYIEVHYEDLVSDTGGVLRRVAEFIELDFDPAMVRYHERAGERLAEKARDLRKPWGTISAASRIESHALAERPPQADRVARWRTEMSEADRRAYEAIAGDTLVAAGYGLGGEGSDSTPAKPASPRLGI
jgi:Sulfotransferase family